MIKYIYLDGEKTDYKIDSSGIVIGKRDCKPLKASINRKGYHLVRLYHKDKRYDIGVHRLVAIHFIENVKPSQYDQVNHIDGNKNNNDIMNLEWCDNSYNQIHAYNNNLHQKLYGEKSHFNKYTQEFIRQICEDIQSGETNSNIAKKFGVKKSLVSDIRNGRTWEHIGKEYKFKTKKAVVYTEVLIRKICELYEKGLTNKEVRLKLKLEHNNSTKALLSNIRNRLRWNHVTEQYKW